MRILGLGLLTILLVALLRFTLITPDIASFVGLESTDGRRTYDLALQDAQEECLPPGSGTLHTFPLRERDTWNALTGAPGFTSVSFDLPRQANVIGGALILDIAAELQEEAVARLRINVNGERRGEIVLAAGRADSEIRIDLRPRDLMQGTLDVSLATVGTFPQRMCEPGWNGGLIVRIEPSSRVELRTDGPLTDIGDRLLVSGSPQRLVWPSAGAGETGAVDLVAFAVDRRVRGLQSVFVPQTQDSCSGAIALEPSDLAALSRSQPSPGADVVPADWPVSVARTGPNATARFFGQSEIWRHAYDLRAMPDAEYPTALDLRMRVAGLTGDAAWLLSVTLNDSLIHSERLTGNTLDIVREVALPFELQAVSNRLDVRIVKADGRDLAICVGAETTSTAQMLPTTKLLGGVAPDDPSLGEFLSAVTGPVQLRLSDMLTATDATGAVDFLADTFGGRVLWRSEGPVDPALPYVHVTTGGDLEAQFDSMRETWANHDFWFAAPQRAENGDLPYRLIPLSRSTGSDVDLGEAPRIGAIVATPRVPGASDFGSLLISDP